MPSWGETASADAIQSRHDKGLAIRTGELSLADLAEHFDVSVRLRNCIVRAPAQLRATTLAEYIKRYPEIEREFLHIPHAGRKTVKELSDVVLKVSRATEPHVSANGNDSSIVVGQLNGEIVQAVRLHGAEELLKFLGNILEPRQFDILMRRYGIFSPAETLEQLGATYRLTRERIRQIEAKVKRKCGTAEIKPALFAYLEREQQSLMTSALGGNRCALRNDALAQEADLEPLPLLCIDICYGSYEQWLNATLKVALRRRHVIGWVLPSQDDGNELLENLLAAKPATGSLRRRVLDALTDCHWPVRLTDLYHRLPGVSSSRITDCLRYELKVEIDGDVVTTTQHLPMRFRMLIILKSERRPQSFKDIRAKHLAFFREDVEEHTVGAAVSRLKEAVIVERGAYSLYEDLPLSTSAIKKICDTIYKYIKTVGYYVSTKLLQRVVVQELSPDVCQGLTHYMILGFCHADLRFSVKRGLMIGLSTRHFEARFVSLNDTVHEIMEMHAPLRISEIKKHMAHERDVLDVSILGILKNSPEFILADRGLYDLLQHVIGNSDAVTRLSDAVLIALLGKGAGAQILMSRLAAVGMKYDMPTVISFLSHMPAIQSTRGVFHLSAPPSNVAHYNRLFEHVYEPGLDHAVLRSRLSTAGADAELVKIDYRLAMNRSTWDHADTRSNPKVLQELLQEFDFA